MDQGTLLRPNFRGFASSALLFPLRLAGVARELAGRIGDVSVMDVLAGLSAALPTGLYDSGAIERYVEEVLSDPDRSNDFRLLEQELYIPVTDLDTTERVVLGEGEWADLPISSAVAASAALPMVYTPVELRGRQFVDGGIRSTTNIGVAVERGAKFIVVVNPLVPFVKRFPPARSRPRSGPVPAASPTWASPRSAIRPSGSCPTTGSSAQWSAGTRPTPASTSS